MTICIAAICESGKNVVACADRMFTAPAPLNLEFETEEQKVEQLAPRCAALISGNSGYGTEVLNAVRQNLRGSQNPTIADVSESLKNQYASIRAHKADETIVLSALGSDFSAFLQKGGTLPSYLQLQPGIYQQLVMAMQQFNMNVEIIVAGIDQSGAHIYRVSHPGTAICLDKLGYDAIGSGGIHALTRLYLGAQTTHRSLIETLYAVYDAKKASEVAPGVGTHTDIAVIDSQSGIKPCAKPVLDALEQIHWDATQKLSPDLDTLRKVYDKP